jgi:LPLT family lysophospholipid transporter-like MFS transporter
LQFARELREFLDTGRARFAVIGAGLFWAAAAVLRVIIVAWAPVTLGMHNAGEIAELTLFLGLGIMVGAAIVPRLIPLAQLRRARLAAYAMSGLILLLSATSGLHAAQATLFAIGLAGGIFVVPINAALQAVGHQSIGAGSAVAIQGFFENLAMLAGVGLYGSAAAWGASPVAALVVLGSGVLAATIAVSAQLPAVPANGE